MTGLDMSNVTHVPYMFSDCTSLTSVNLSGLDASSVTDMSGVFSGCTSLTSLDLSALDTSKARDMSYLFSGCTSLASLNLSGWDTSSAEDLHNMFYCCSSLASVDLSAFDTSRATDMGGMFSGCSSLATLDLSAFNTSKATDMGSMFWCCTSLATLDLSTFDTSSAANMSDMFFSCSSLRKISLGDKFSFAGANGKRMCSLPTLSADGLTGKWVGSVDGKPYSPSEVPNNVATYTAERGVSPDSEPDPVPVFPDVDYFEGSWYVDGVTFCAEKGLITGYTSGDDAGKFGGGRTLTRAQLAAILWRNAEPEAAEAYDGNAANSTGMGDVADNAWYTGAANWA